MIRITIIITCKFNAYNFRIISIEILKMSNVRYHADTCTSWYMRPSLQLYKFEQQLAYVYERR